MVTETQMLQTFSVRVNDWRARLTSSFIPEVKSMLIGKCHGSSEFLASGLSLHCEFLSIAV